MKTMNFTNFASAVLIGLALGIPVSAPADDTEIFTGANLLDGIKPNVIFILDTSGSMSSFDNEPTDRLDRMKEALFDLLDSVDNVNIGLMRFHTPGGPILFPVAAVDADASLVEADGQGAAPGLTSVTVRVTDDADDAEELFSITSAGTIAGKATAGDVKLDSLYLDLLDGPAFGTEIVPPPFIVNRSGSDAEQGTRNEGNYLVNGTVLDTQTNGLRFRDVEKVDQDTDGATVLFSQLLLTSLDASSGPLDLKVFGLFAGDMPEFPGSETSLPCTSAVGNDIYCRLGLITRAQRIDLPLNFDNVGSYSTGGALGGNVTKSIVTWPNVPNTATNEEIGSPDLSSVVQEIFDHPDWQTSSSADDLGIFYTGTTASSRKFYTFDTSGSPGDDERAAKLIVHYVKAGNTAGRHMVGLRFRNVQIPQGALLSDVKLTFNSVGQSDDAVSINISGEKVASAPSFSAITAGVPNTPTEKISARRTANPTTASVNWSVPATEKWTHEGFVQTPDITPVLQEIVSQIGWCGSNDLVLFLDYNTVPGAPSDRRVFAHDADPSLAATLKFDYNKSEFAPGTGCTVETVVRQVSASSDDAEEDVSRGRVVRNSGTLNLIKNGRKEQTVGVIFRDVEVPAAASTTVLNAVVEFTPREDAAANATSVTVTGEDDDVIAPFGSSKRDISARIAAGSATTATVGPFNFPTFAAPADTVAATPDLSSVITEITKRPGWKSGNDIALIFTGSTGETRLFAFERDPSKAARLRLRVKYNIGDVIVAAVDNGPPSAVSVRNRLKELITDLTHNGLTPIVDTLYEAALYFRGSPVDYGASRGTSGSTVKRNTRLSHTGSYEFVPGVVQYPSGCNTDDSNLSSDACEGQTISAPTPKYKSPIQQSCQANFIVLLTDGSANSNNSKTKIKNLTGVGNCTVTLPDGDACGVDLVKFLNENDQSSTVGGLNNVVTYTIGFNISNQFLKDLAIAGGGAFFEADTSASLSGVFQNIITDVLSRTTSFAAPSLSVNAFNRLEDRNEVYFSLFEPSPNASWAGNVKKFQLCQSSLDDCVTVSGALVGDVLDSRAPPLKAVGDDGRILDTALSFWSTTPDGSDVLSGGGGADIIARGFAVRRVLTFSENASQTTTQPTGTVNFFQPAVPPSIIPVSSGRDLSLPENVLIDSDSNGVIDGLNTGSAAQKEVQTQELLGLASTATAIEVRDQIDWIRGKDVDAKFSDAAFGPNRYAFGDPLHGNPLALTYGGSAADPIIKLVVGTNDGGIRFINSFSGQEEWVFFPPATMLPLQTTLRADASGPKEYGIDGSATPWIQDKGDLTGNKIGVIEPDKGDFIRIFIGQRRGGNQYWGLDISPTTEIPADQKTAIDNVNPKLMWRIRGGDSEFPMLGDTWSRPFLTTMLLGNDIAGQAVRKEVLIFAGGYDEGQDSGFQETTDVGNAIYVVDAETGARLFYVGGGLNADALHASSIAPVVGVQVPEMLFPIPSDVAAFDSDGDGATDRIYVGDTGGQMWRVDFAPNRAVGTANIGLRAVVGKLAEVSSSPAKIAAVPGGVLSAADQRKFFFPPSVIQVRGAGSEASRDYDLVSAVTGNRANPLNLTVQDRFYAFRDYTLAPFIDADNNGLADGYATLEGDLQVALAGGASGTAFGDLTDLTSVDQLSDLTDSAKDAFTDGGGYFINLVSLGEKGLAAPVTIAGKLFFTTYLPEGVVSSTECTLAEGRGQLYGINAITGEPIFNYDNSADPNNLTKGDRTYALGAGIPSNPVPVFFPEKVMLLIGVGGGAEAVDPEIAVPQGRTYWLEQQSQ